MAMMEYTIKLTAQEVTLLGEVLGNAPYRTIAALMAKLQQQVSEQEQKEKSPDLRVVKQSE
jgi:hypothetical protein